MPSPIVIFYTLNSTATSHPNHLLVTPFGASNQITIQGLFFDPDSSMFVLSGGGVSFSQFTVTSRTGTVIQGTFEAWGLLFPGTPVSITLDVFNAYDASTHSFPVALPPLVLGAPAVHPHPGPPAPAPAPPVVGTAPVPMPNPTGFDLNPGTTDDGTLLTDASPGAMNAITVVGTGFTSKSVLFFSDDRGDTFPSPPTGTPTTLNADGSLSANFLAISAPAHAPATGTKLPQGTGTSTQLTVSVGNPVDGAGMRSGFIPQSVDYT